MVDGEANMNETGNSDVFSRLQARQGSRRNMGISPRLPDPNMLKQNSKDQPLAAVASCHMVHDKHKAHESQVYAMTSVGN